VWVRHQSGFTSAIVVGGNVADGKVKVKLDRGKLDLEISKSDVEKANPAAYDRIENLSNLKFINECSCLHTLRHRFHSNLNHTFVGESLVIINSILPLCIYSEKIMSMFKDCSSDDVIPHVYATAQSTYDALFNNFNDDGL
ncbi:hypothetical protein HELRODRAFT_151549, partial [Helobdella robusta]|uniref:Myosin motor domain-containing protein n=1 Tax=Helobdella robusta TaxID=6412 RepID=T1EKL0_HELRO